MTEAVYVHHVGNLKVAQAAMVAIMALRNDMALRIGRAERLLASSRLTARRAARLADYVETARDDARRYRRMSVALDDRFD